MLLDLVTKESERLAKQIERLEKRVDKSQKSVLSCNKNGKSYRWNYWSRGKSEQLLKSELTKARKLAAATYNKYLLEDCIQEKKALDYYIKHHALEGGKSEKYISNPEVCKLLQVQYKSKDKELEEWSNADYPANPNHPESLIIRSATGRMVRSKSEAIIDMLLQQNCIPHRYEDEFATKEATFRPDFTIRHPQTKEFFLWEHFGLMDESEYCRSASEKLRAYASQGFYPAINLIITSETIDHPLDISLVIAIIEHYFK